ncbi:MAG: hypothetical protein EBU90_16115 [Proteobacteria bacterium]|nr:hypothetical protein [Pseudomonadota bacterium]NBP15147.1 hypothetical protein [bacterium]
MKLKVLFLLLVGSAIFNQETVARAPYVFVDFPLSKIDLMYKEQGGPVATLVFDLWVCTNQYIQDNLTDRIVYHDKALPSFKKLNTFKRFIDELCVEWANVYHKKSLVLFFQKMFARNQGKAYLHNLSEQEFNSLLYDLRSFLWDVAHNAPHARQKCIETLQQPQIELFQAFLATSYEV